VSLCASFFCVAASFLFALPQPSFPSRAVQPRINHLAGVLHDHIRRHSACLRPCQLCLPSQPGEMEAGVAAGLLRGRRRAVSGCFKVDGNLAGGRAGQRECVVAEQTQQRCLRRRRRRRRRVGPQVGPAPRGVSVAECRHAASAHDWEQARPCWNWGGGARCF
jgi:hypothetical protein